MPLLVNELICILTEYPGEYYSLHGTLGRDQNYQQVKKKMLLFFCLFLVVSFWTKHWESLIKVKHLMSRLENFKGITEFCS